MNNDFQISDHFKLSEFEDPSGVVMLDSVLVQKLETLRVQLGNGPIEITSGYRTDTHNEAVGGVQGSQHELGKAADIVVPGHTVQEVAQYARNVGFTGIGVYTDGHVHVDIRPGPLVQWTG